MENNVTYSFRVAVASSDGINIDNHFGSAEKFYIFEVNQDETWEQIEIRENINLKDKSPEDTGCEKHSCEGSCGGGQRGCKGAVENVKFLSDCSYLFATKVGHKSSKVLLREDIGVLEVSMPIKDAFPKLIAYEKRRSKNWTVKRKNS